MYGLGFRVQGLSDVGGRMYVGGVVGCEVLCFMIFGLEMEYGSRLSLHGYEDAGGRTHLGSDEHRSDFKIRVYAAV